jgi:Na+-transporting NADH:ubiquinone oxidoreductase subunit C
VLLKDRQVSNALLDKQKKVLAVSGVAEHPERLTTEEVTQVFQSNIVTEIVNLETGGVVTSEFDDPGSYNQQAAKSDPNMSKSAPRNPAGVARIPLYAAVYRVVNEAGDTLRYVLPIEGKGLWSTLYGFLALDTDLTTIRGLTFYQHGETPGLGGEVDNPRWIAEWPERKAFNEEGEPAIRVIKGAAPPPDVAPHQVDGLSGATITSNGVTYLLQFWLGEHGFGPYLSRLRAEGSTA